jgi:2-haloacid dehalogenase
MHRHQFLELFLGAGAMLASPWGCAASAVNAAPAGGAAPGPIGGICFDLFTLFDPRGVERAASALVGARASELCETWRARQFQYSWLRSAAGQYRDFRAITRDALDYALFARGVSLSEPAREDLVEAHSRLEPWPDTRDALLAWRCQGLALAPLANYSPPMIARLLANAGLESLFDAQLSTHAVQSFKPDPRAYALGEAAFGLPRSRIAFAAFGGWDAAGAKWFGYRTFWVNRLGVAPEALQPGFDATGPTFHELARFVAES